VVTVKEKVEQELVGQENRKTKGFSNPRFKKRAGAREKESREKRGSDMAKYTYDVSYTSTPTSNRYVGMNVIRASE
jgi:hypothetical protein